MIYKSKFIKVILCVFLSITMPLLIFGCDDSNDNSSTPQESIKLLPPYLISFGSYISWESNNQVNEYEIYCNGEYIDKTYKSTYEINKTKSDTEYYIVAKKGSIRSDKSNVVTVSKNCEYFENEILDLTDKVCYSASIPSNIRKVIIGKETSSLFELSAEIEERSTDLTFELHNVEISGRIFNFDYSYSRLKYNFNVLLEVYGDCSIDGVDGRNGFDFSDSQYNNCAIDAGKGNAGSGAIVAPSIIISGFGNLSLSGGNGGDGGKGSATTKWETHNGPGKGADGGNGGAAVLTSYFILNMTDGDCTVTVVDGKGGKKGTPGVNGSILTGPVVSAMWKDIYDIGKNGTDGLSKFGKQKIIVGKLIH